ncbi:MAG: TPM domain-containing protein [Saprospiraceae bacterium]|nr:TPM domain-containing protein [Saprospiraceae bacterium]
MIQFFNSEEEVAIVAAIRDAERKTSGEVRVHIEKNCRADVLDETVRVFRKLDMHRTAARNGVLLFIAPERREFAIIGDEGINAVVPAGFWDEERDLMLTHFRQGQFAAGICAAIAGVGEKLKEHFPVAGDDENELPDDISYG